MISLVRTVLESCRNPTINIISSVFITISDVCYELVVLVAGNEYTLSIHIQAVDSAGPAPWPAWNPRHPQRASSDVIF